MFWNIHQFVYSVVTTINGFQVDCEQRIEMNLQVEGFPRHGTLTLPSPPATFRGDVRLHDDGGRRLVLNVAVDLLQGAGVRISVSAPYWVSNSTTN